MNLIDCQTFTEYPLYIPHNDALTFCNCFNLLYNMSGRVCIFDETLINRNCNLTNQTMDGYIGCRNKQCNLIKELPSDECYKSDDLTSGGETYVIIFTFLFLFFFALI